MLKASATATTACSRAVTTITRTLSNRSATIPASGASATTGTSVAANRADTATPLPVSSVDLQGQHDQREQVPGRRQEDGPAQQAQVALVAHSPAGRMFWLSRKRFSGSYSALIRASRAWLAP